MTSHTILVAGATGNTDKNVVRTLAKLLEGQDIRILALTRSLESDAAKELANIVGVEMEAKDWTEIDAAWLTDRAIKKAFIAPQNGFVSMLASPIGIVRWLTLEQSSLSDSHNSQMSLPSTSPYSMSESSLL
jgi:hypothetical protein